MASTVQIPANTRGRYVGPPSMVYKSDFETGSRLLTGNGYELPPTESVHHGMSHYSHQHQSNQQQYPARNFVPHYDDVMLLGHHDGSGGRLPYQQRMNVGGWPSMPVAQPQPQQQHHHVYPSYHHQSFCAGQNNESVLQSDHCGWTVRNATVRQADTSKTYHHQLQHQHHQQQQQQQQQQHVVVSRDRGSYLSHCEPGIKRRLSLENSSTIFEHLPPTPTPTPTTTTAPTYSTGPLTPSFHSGYPSSSSTYLAPSPPSSTTSSSVNLACPLTGDPFAPSRASIPLDHFPPTPYSEDLHSPNSEHSGYSSSSSSASTTPPSVSVSSAHQDNPFETGQNQLSCLDAYDDSQRTSNDDDEVQRHHSSSFDAREQVRTLDQMKRNLMLGHLDKMFYSSCLL